MIDPNLNRLYVANTGDNTVSVFDTTNVTFRFAGHSAAGEGSGWNGANWRGRFAEWEPVLCGQLRLRQRYRR
jgi:hypothetical protein